MAMLYTYGSLCIPKNSSHIRTELRALILEILNFLIESRLTFVSRCVFLLRVDVGLNTFNARRFSDCREV